MASTKGQGHSDGNVEVLILEMLIIGRQGKVEVLNVDTVTSDRH